MKKRILSLILCFILSSLLIQYSNIKTNAEENSSIDYSEYYIKNYAENLEDEKYIIISDEDKNQVKNNYRMSYIYANYFYSEIIQRNFDYKYSIWFRTKSDIKYEDIKKILSRYDTKFLFGFTYSDSYLINELHKLFIPGVIRNYINKNYISTDLGEDFEKLYDQYTDKLNKQFKGDEKEYFEFLKHLSVYGDRKYEKYSDVYNIYMILSDDIDIGSINDDYYWDNQNMYFVRFENETDCLAAISELNSSEYISDVSMHFADTDEIKENSIVIKGPYALEGETDTINKIKEEVANSLLKYDINYTTYPQSEGLKKRTSASYLVLSDIKREEFDEVFSIVKKIKDSKEGIYPVNPYNKLYITKGRCVISFNEEKKIYRNSSFVEERDIPYTKYLKIGYKNSDKYVVTRNADTFLKSINEDSIIYPLEEIESKTIYRLYNKHTGEHLFTSKESEYNKLGNLGWVKEGETFITYSDSEKGAGVYRVYNPNAKGGDHHYTKSYSEAEKLVGKGWKWDNNAKPLFYAKGETKVYRLYNKTNGRHHYTPKVKEKEKLVGLGWIDEGIGWEALE